MIALGYACDNCIYEKREKKDGWILTCKAFPDGIDIDYVFEGHPERRKECNNGIGFTPRENSIVQKEA